MHRPAGMAASACLAALGVVAATAAADTMDPALERLAVPCPTAAGVCPDNAAFKRFTNQLGLAMAPLAMYPARTTGYGGVQVVLQGSYTTIDAKADYWKYGTRGPTDPSTGRYSVRNVDPSSILQLYAINVRKGIPFGFEFGGTFGILAQTSLLVAGADIRWSLLEGFRTGWAGVLPDVAIAGGVRTLTGTPQIQLTVASFDVTLSKPIPIADSSIVTPYIGYQWLNIFANSGLIDFTPGVDALAACGYQGQNVPGTPAATPPYTGESICSTQVRDSNNNHLFDAARMSRQRLVLGLMYRYEMIVLGAHLMPEIAKPEKTNSGAEAAALQGVPGQTTFGFQVGVAF